VPLVQQRGKRGIVGEAVRGVVGVVAFGENDVGVLDPAAVPLRGEDDGAGAGRAQYRQATEVVDVGVGDQDHVQRGQAPQDLRQPRQQFVAGQRRRPRVDEHGAVAENQVMTHQFVAKVRLMAVQARYNLHRCPSFC